MMPTRWLAVLALLQSAAVEAEVVASDTDGFVSEHVLVLQAPPARAYAALTSEIAGWWDPAHSYSGVAANFSLDARAGGCFCEALPDGGSVMHMQVVYAGPGELLRLEGGLGPLQGMGVSGAMSFGLEAMGEGQTRLTYRYVVSGYSPDGPDGLAGLAEPVDQVQLGQLQRLAAYLAR